MIRVVIVDDHALVRSAVRVLLNVDPNICVEAEGASAEEAVRLARLRQPDVMLLDLALPGRSGLEVIPEVRAAAPRTRVLIVSMLDDRGYVRAAFAAGASGYLLKDAADTELGVAIVEVASGGQYVYPQLGAQLAGGEALEPDDLSKREREVLKLVVLGYGNDEISTMLDLSIRTLDKHRRNLKRKLRVSTRAQLVNYAINRGMLKQERFRLSLPRPARSE